MHIGLLPFPKLRARWAVHRHVSVLTRSESGCAARASPPAQAPPATPGPPTEQATSTDATSSTAPRSEKSGAMSTARCATASTHPGLDQRERDRALGPLAANEADRPVQHRGDAVLEAREE